MTIEELKAANSVLAGKIHAAMQEYYDQTKCTVQISTDWIDISTWGECKFIPDVSVSPVIK